DHGVAAVERFAKAALIVVERLEPRFGCRDLRFDTTNAAGGIDQVPIELAAVGAELFDFALERRFALGRLALRVTRGLEILITLLEGVELFRFIVLCEVGRPFLRRRSKRHRPYKRKPRDERRARIATAEAANHCSQVTPTGCDSKVIIAGRSCRQIKTNLRRFL